MTNASGPDDWANKVEDLRDQASHKADATGANLRADAHAAAAELGHRSGDAADAVSSRIDDAKDSAAAKASNVRDSASAIATDLKSQASAHVEDAKGVITSMADEARARISGIIDQQKSLGADKLSGLSQVAHKAAGDLDGQNPAVAKLVRDAAGSVDMIAGNLRSSNITDVIASVSTFARRQPVAFFAGSVLAGFALARFIKSEPAHPDRTVGDDRS